LKRPITSEVIDTVAEVEREVRDAQVADEAAEAAVADEFEDAAAQPVSSVGGGSGWVRESEALPVEEQAGVVERAGADADVVPLDDARDHSVAGEDVAEAEVAVDDVRRRE
jgi:hypothetical protein